jgi:hypothetical protein
LGLQTYSQTSAVVYFHRQHQMKSHLRGRTSFDAFCGFGEIICMICSFPTQWINKMTPLRFVCFYFPTNPCKRACRIFRKTKMPRRKGQAFVDQIVDSIDIFSNSFVIDLENLSRLKHFLVRD